MCKKVTFFLFISFLSIIITLPVTYLYKSILKEGVLFFSAFFIAFLCSIFSFCLWHRFYKEKFENFLVFIILFLISAIFIYLGPTTIDRSLSSFIYFYSVEKKEINRDIYDEKYFADYIQRRFEDGQKIGFLKCDDNYCKPTFKTKLLYTLLYPCAKVSNTIVEYENFKNVMIKNNK